MRDPGQFDAFYAAARQRLLLQAFALTGDLGAAKRAVRDGYVAAWHHWHKVVRQDDPEAWVRPLVWQHAQRRHTAHFWRREGSLAEEHRATLDALDELTSVQRRALLLHVLAGLESEAFCHEIGLTEASAARQLRLAAAQFAIHREIDPADVPGTLQALGEPLEAIRLPRASIIRRSGTARRRAHTSLGVAAATAIAVGAGFAVSHDATSTASLTGERGASAPEPGTVNAVVHLDTADLLAGADVTRLAPRPLDETGTGNNTDGTGLNLPCQTRRYADPKALAALVRHFEAPLVPKKQPATDLVQVVERSADSDAAATAYASTLAWFSDCAGKRIQMRQSFAINDAGDQGALIVLRDWAKPVTTWTIGVARTGDIVTTLARSVASDRTPVYPGFLRAVGTAVDRLCTADGGGTCAGKPRTALAPPPPGASAQGMLQAVDLPSIAGVPRAWVGTSPRRASTNPAATTCDNASFSGHGITSSMTRTFLMPQAHLPAQFGLSETLGRFSSVKAARDFTAGIEKRMKSCEDHDLSATVDEFRHQPKGPFGATHAWRLTIEVSDSRSIDFWVAVVRRGASVAQIGFVPVQKATISQGQFQTIVDRGLARLENLPHS